MSFLSFQEVEPKCPPLECGLKRLNSMEQLQRAGYYSTVASLGVTSREAPLKRRILRKVGRGTRRGVKDKTWAMPTT